MPDFNDPEILKAKYAELARQHGDDLSSIATRFKEATGKTLVVSEPIIVQNREDLSKMMNVLMSDSVSQLAVDTEVMRSGKPGTIQISVADGPHAEKTFTVLVNAFRQQPSEMSYLRSEVSRAFHREGSHQFYHNMAWDVGRLADDGFKIPLTNGKGEVTAHDTLALSRKMGAVGVKEDAGKNNNLMELALRKLNTFIPKKLSGVDFGKGQDFDYMEEVSKSGDMNKWFLRYGASDAAGLLRLVRKFYKADGTLNGANLSTSGAVTPEQLAKLEKLNTAEHVRKLIHRPPPGLHQMLTEENRQTSRVTTEGGRLYVKSYISDDDINQGELAKIVNPDTIRQRRKELEAAELAKLKDGSSEADKKNALARAMHQHQMEVTPQLASRGINLWTANASVLTGNSDYNPIAGIRSVPKWVAREIAGKMKLFKGNRDSHGKSVPTVPSNFYEAIELFQKTHNPMPNAYVERIKAMVPGGLTPENIDKALKTAYGTVSKKPTVEDVISGFGPFGVTEEAIRADPDRWIRDYHKHQIDNWMGLSEVSKWFPRKGKGGFAALGEVVLSAMGRYKHTKSSVQGFTGAQAYAERDNALRRGEAREILMDMALPELYSIPGLATFRAKKSASLIKYAVQAKDADSIMQEKNVLSAVKGEYYDPDSIIRYARLGKFDNSDEGKIERLKSLGYGDDLIDQMMEEGGATLMEALQNPVLYNESVPWTESARIAVTDDVKDYALNLHARKGGYSDNIQAMIDRVVQFDEAGNLKLGVKDQRKIGKKGDIPLTTGWYQGTVGSDIAGLIAPKIFRDQAFLQNMPRYTKDIYKTQNVDGRTVAHHAGVKNYLEDSYDFFTQPDILKNIPNQKSAVEAARGIQRALKYEMDYRNSTGGKSFGLSNAKVLKMNEVFSRILNQRVLPGQRQLKMDLMQASDFVNTVPYEVEDTTPGLEFGARGLQGEGNWEAVTQTTSTDRGKLRFKKGMSQQQVAENLARYEGGFKGIHDIFREGKDIDAYTGFIDSITAESGTEEGVDTTVIQGLKSVAKKMVMESGDPGMQQMAMDMFDMDIEKFYRKHIDPEMYSAIAGGLNNTRGAPTNFKFRVMQDLEQGKRTMLTSDIFKTNDDAFINRLIANGSIPQDYDSKRLYTLRADELGIPAFGIGGGDVTTPEGKVQYVKPRQISMEGSFNQKVAQAVLGMWGPELRQHAFGAMGQEKVDKKLDAEEEKARLEGSSYIPVTAAKIRKSPRIGVRKSGYADNSKLPFYEDVFGTHSVVSDRIAPGRFTKGKKSRTKTRGRVNYEMEDKDYSVRFIDDIRTIVNQTTGFADSADASGPLMGTVGGVINRYLDVFGPSGMHDDLFGLNYTRYTDTQDDTTYRKLGKGERHVMAKAIEDSIMGRDDAIDILGDMRNATAGWWQSQGMKAKESIGVPTIGGKASRAVPTDFKAPLGTSLYDWLTRADETTDIMATFKGVNQAGARGLSMMRGHILDGETPEGQDPVLAAINWYKNNRRAPADFYDIVDMVKSNPVAKPGRYSPLVFGQNGKSIPQNARTTEPYQVPSKVYREMMGFGSGALENWVDPSIDMDQLTERFADSDVVRSITEMQEFMRQGMTQEEAINAFRGTQTGDDRYLSVVDATRQFSTADLDWDHLPGGSKQDNSEFDLRARPNKLDDLNQEILGDMREWKLFGRTIFSMPSGPQAHPWGNFGTTAGMVPSGSGTPAGEQPGLISRMMRMNPFGMSGKDNTPIGPHVSLPDWKWFDAAQVPSDMTKKSGEQGKGKFLKNINWYKTWASEGLLYDRLIDSLVAKGVIPKRKAGGFIKGSFIGAEGGLPETAWSAKTGRLMGVLSEEGMYHAKDPAVILSHNDSKKALPHFFGGTADALEILANLNAVDMRVMGRKTEDFMNMGATVGQNPNDIYASMMDMLSTERAHRATPQSARGTGIARRLFGGFSQRRLAKHPERLGIYEPGGNVLLRQMAGNLGADPRNLSELDFSNAQGATPAQIASYNSVGQNIRARTARSMNLYDIQQRGGPDVNRDMANVYGNAMQQAFGKFNRQVAGIASGTKNATLASGQTAGNTAVRGATEVSEIQKQIRSMVEGLRSMGADQGTINSINRRIGQGGILGGEIYSGAGGQQQVRDAFKELVGTVSALNPELRTMSGLVNINNQASRRTASPEYRQSLMKEGYIGNSASRFIQNTTRGIFGAGGSGPRGKIMSDEESTVEMHRRALARQEFGDKAIRFLKGRPDRDVKETVELGFGGQFGKESAEGQALQAGIMAKAEKFFQQNFSSEVGDRWRNLYKMQTGTVYDSADSANKNTTTMSQLGMSSTVDADLVKRKFGSVAEYERAFREEVLGEEGMSEKAGVSERQQYTVKQGQRSAKVSADNSAWLGSASTIQGHGRRMTALSMGAMGTYFSVTGLYGAITQGISMVTDSLKDLSSSMKSIGIMDSFSDGMLKSSTIMDSIGVKQDDFVKGWMRLNSLTASLQVFLGAVAAKVFTSGEGFNNIAKTLNNVFASFSNGETINKLVISIQTLMEAGAALLPVFVDLASGLADLMSGLAKHKWLAAMVLQFTILAFVMQPVLTIFATLIEAVALFMTIMGYGIPTMSLASKGMISFGTGTAFASNSVWALNGALATTLSIVGVAIVAWQILGGILNSMTNWNIPTPVSIAMGAMNMVSGSNDMMASNCAGGVVKGYPEGGPVQKQSIGGFLKGLIAPGDNTLASIRDDEFVVNPKATRENLGLLNFVNSSSHALGGLVGGGIPGLLPSATPAGEAGENVTYRNAFGKLTAVTEEGAAGSKGTAKVLQDASGGKFLYTKNVDAANETAGGKGDEVDRGGMFGWIMPALGGIGQDLVKGMQNIDVPTVIGAASGAAPAGAAMGIMLPDIGKWIGDWWSKIQWPDIGKIVGEAWKKLLAGLGLTGLNEAVKKFLFGDGAEKFSWNENIKKFLFGEGGEKFSWNENIKRFLFGEGVERVNWIELIKNFVLGKEQPRTPEFNEVKGARESFKVYDPETGVRDAKAKTPGQKSLSGELEPGKRPVIDVLNDPARELGITEETTGGKSKSGSTWSYGDEYGVGSEKGSGYEPGKGSKAGSVWEIGDPESGKGTKGKGVNVPEGGFKTIPGSVGPSMLEQAKGGAKGGGLLAMLFSGVDEVFNKKKSLAEAAPTIATSGLVGAGLGALLAAVPVLGGGASMLGHDWMTNFSANTAKTFTGGQWNEETGKVEGGNKTAADVAGMAGSTFNDVSGWAMTGAAIGSVVPGAGTLAGAAVGAGVGLTIGGIQDLFKIADESKAMRESGDTGHLTGQYGLVGSGIAMAYNLGTDVREGRGIPGAIGQAGAATGEAITSGVNAAITGWTNAVNAGATGINTAATATTTAATATTTAATNFATAIGTGAVNVGTSMVGIGTAIIDAVKGGLATLSGIGDSIRDIILGMIKNIPVVGGVASTVVGAVTDPLGTAGKLINGITSHADGGLFTKTGIIEGHAGEVIGPLGAVADIMAGAAATSASIYSKPSGEVSQAMVSGGNTYQITVPITVQGGDRNQADEIRRALEEALPRILKGFDTKGVSI